MLCAARSSRMSYVAKRCKHSAPQIPISVLVQTPYRFTPPQLYTDKVLLIGMAHTLSDKRKIDIAGGGICGQKLYPYSIAYAPALPIGGVYQHGAMHQRQPSGG